MPEKVLHIIHPTASGRVATGPADDASTLRQVCADLQTGGFLPATVALTGLGATNDRTGRTLPMTMPIGQLDLQNEDWVTLIPASQGASR